MSSWIRVAISPAVDLVVTLGGFGWALALALPFPFADAADDGGGGRVFVAGAPGTKSGASARRLASPSAAISECKAFPSWSDRVKRAPKPRARMARDRCCCVSSFRSPFCPCPPRRAPLPRPPRRPDPLPSLFGFRGRVWPFD